MKKLVSLTFLSSLFLSACAAPEPVVVTQPQIIERHHYHTQTRRVYVPTTTTRSKAAPSVGSSSSAEGFRAIEQPGTYSQ